MPCIKIVFSCGINIHIYQFGRSTFATEGPDCKVNEQVAKAIKDFHARKKPIGYVQANVCLQYLAH